MARAALFLVALIAAVGLLSGSPAATEAHANLARSEPAAGELVPVSPDEIVIEFTETTEREFTGVQVYDSTGAVVAEGLLSPVGGGGLVLSFALPPLENGTYTVVWRNVSSVDGHPRNGSFSFHVGERSGDVVEVGPGSVGGPPKFASVLSRWATFVAHVLLVGIAACTAIVLLPALRRANAGEPVRGALFRVLSRLWWGTILAAIVIAVVALVMQAWRSAGGFSDGLSAIDGLIADSRFGRLWLAKMVILGLMAYGTLLLDRRLFRMPDATTWFAMLGGAVALVAAISLGSHAAASQEATRELGTFADFVHTTFAGVWLGGLVVLALAIGVSLRSGDATGLLREAMPRFSVLALAAVVAIAVTGVLQWYLRVGNLDDTVNSDYGQSIIAKTVLLLPMLGLGALNLFVLRPTLVTATGDVALRAGRFLRRHVVAEAALGAMVLLATAFLTDTSPPDATSAARPDAIEQRMEQGDLRIDLTIAPGSAGANDLTLELDDRDGPTEAVRNVIVRLRYLDDDFGQSEAQVEERAEAMYGVTGAQFGVPGNWEVLVIVQRQGVPDVTVTYEVAIR